MHNTSTRQTHWIGIIKTESPPYLVKKKFMFEIWAIETIKKERTVQQNMEINCGNHIKVISTMNATETKKRNTWNALRISDRVSSRCAGWHCMAHLYRYSTEIRWVTYTTLSNICGIVYDKRPNETNVYIYRVQC